MTSLNNDPTKLPGTDSCLRITAAWKVFQCQQISLMVKITEECNVQCFHFPLLPVSLGIIVSRNTLLKDFSSSTSSEYNKAQANCLRLLGVSRYTNKKKVLSEFYEFFSLTVLGWKDIFEIDVAITQGLTLRFQQRCIGL